MKHTAAILLTLLVPAALAAQQDTSRSAVAHHRAARTTHTRHYQTSNGSVASRGSMGLSSDEISQLQTALESDGCSPGPVDGVLGAHTRRAMACARKKLGVSSSDPNALLHALNLSFTTTGNGMGSIERSGARGRARGVAHDSTMMHPDTGAMSGSRMSHEMGGMHGSMRPDSARRHRTSGDTGTEAEVRRPRASIPRTPRPDSTRRP